MWKEQYTYNITDVDLIPNLISIYDILHYDIFRFEKIDQIDPILRRCKKTLKFRLHFIPI